jgi:hypothetical protein
MRGVDRAHHHPGKIGTFFKAGAALIIISTALVSSTIPFNDTSAHAPSSCTLRWDVVHLPGGFPERNDIRSPCEINTLVTSPDGQTIYALDIPNASTGPLVNAGIWRSEDGGISWSLRPTRWLAQSGLAPIFPIADIAIAPDDPDFIAVVCMDAAGTHRREVYVSQDGGVNWSYSGRIPWLYGPNEQIGDIAISPLYSWKGISVRDILVGTRNPADGVGAGEVYVLRCPGLYTWNAQGFGNGDIIGLKLSPHYFSDLSLIVMSSTVQRTFVNIGYRDFAANVCSWNQVANWPVELCEPAQAGGINSGENRIITGGLDLPEDFDGGYPGNRIVFAAYDSNGLATGATQPLDDVYRLNDSVVTRLRVPGFGANPRISSIAYAGNTKKGRLLAGGVRADPVTAAAVAWYTLNPLDSWPAWTRPLKAPTGGFGAGFANVQVAWADGGKNAYCGTGSGNRDTPLKWSNPTGPDWASVALDESAFSVSRDDGISWNQLGLIDTRIHRFRAVAVAADGRTVYASSVNDNGLDSTWRSQTPIAGDTWERVLCIDGAAPLLRLAPDKKDGSGIFWGSQGTTRVICSFNSGQTWSQCLPGAVLQDMAPADSNTLHILQANGLARRGRYDEAGWRWERFTDTELAVAHTIAVQGKNVLAGAAAGQFCPLSYSADGGNSWQRIVEPALSFGNRHVAFDDEFRDNRLIYLGDDAGGLYRWTMGRSHRWDDMITANNSYYGVCPADDGVLYTSYSPVGLAAGVDRTLYSRSGLPKGGISWDSLTAGLGAGVLFRLEPSALACADETIWAIDARDYTPATRTGCLWAFRDTLAHHSPWLIAPKKDSLVLCDPVSGRNAQVDLKWEQLSLADAYEIEIGKDRYFDLLVAQAEPGTNPFYMPDDLNYPAYFINDGLLPEAGHSYWWRVRVRRAVTGQVIRSRWSPAFGFSVRPGFPVVEHPGAGTVITVAPGQKEREVPHPVPNTGANTTNALLTVAIMLFVIVLAVQVYVHRYRK